MKTKEEIIEVISGAEHPAINYSLYELGIVKDIEVGDNVVKLKFAFPFPNIPIADTLINSVAMPLQNISYSLDYEIVLMTDEEKSKFMRMETEAWKG